MTTQQSPLKHLQMSRSLFPIHTTGMTAALNTAGETLGNGDLIVHIRVDDPDYDISATGEDQIAENTTSSSNRGPLKIYVARGSEAVVTRNCRW